MPQCAAANAVQLLLVPSLLLCGSLCGLLLLPRGVQGAITWNGDWAHGCDFAGQDLSNAQVPADQCGPRCTETRGCTHYTWTQWNGGTCWLKSGPVSRNDAKPSGDDVLCGVSPDWNGNMWAFACDFKGGDMGSAQVGPAEQCGPRCSSTAGCTHFTWTPYNGGTCFFKSGNVGRADALTTGDNSMICGISSNPARDLFGVCYDAMHLAEYPLHGGPPGNLAAAMDADFKHMADVGIKYARTYYSAFMGVPVAPAAAKHGIKLYLGVFMTNEGWYKDQVDAAAEAVRAFPGTVEAILVGNENLQPNGPASADEIIGRMAGIRAAVQAKAGRSVPVGTVQRMTEWANGGDAAWHLGQAADIIGANIYTFWGPHNPSDPSKLLDDQWRALVSRYGAAKLRLTETGLPSDGGTSPSGVVANYANAKGYYEGVRNSWLASGATQGHPMFYFAMYDRRPDDNAMGGGVEQHFGLFGHDRRSKGIM